MVEKKYRVFVYGTLMSGERNTHKLVESTLINGNAVTAEASFLMEQFNSSSGGKGKFTPGVQKGGVNHIKGEIWEVDEKTLAILDELEGYDPSKPMKENKYLREKIKMQDGSTALIYIINTNEKDPIPRPHNRIHYDATNNLQSWVREESKLDLY